ncbi:MAG: hypothetical protein ACYTGV_13240, partial [Planctomycetota bacterium]
MRITSCAVLAVVAALLITSGPGMAGDEVPFKGSGTATWVSTDYVNLTSTFTLRGNATHIGKFTGWSIVSYDPTTYLPVGAEMTLVAANGDKLYLSTVSVYDPSTGTATATYTVTGGTGRFDG